ncbi:putative two-component histidine kinase [Weissella oryzae SG25]|uniref:Putative two-component histidine kinase n=1 Tax=Weissella oryzae (strain DSM 25784 / JCM 18191 / LMG 30913 / SG25) TaxID=1329250 RepID=A0A069CVP7_WEIOS|nr:hypothetical protein [Weissella oryzae]GAK31559.1 putative two-component histidine kinase [Weissella oryzae SG25]
MTKNVSQATLNKYRKNLTELKKAEKAVAAKKKQQDALKSDMARALGFEVLEILETDDFEVAFEKVKTLKSVKISENMYDRTLNSSELSTSEETKKAFEFVKQVEIKEASGNGQIN